MKEDGKMYSIVFSRGAFITVDAALAYALEKEKAIQTLKYTDTELTDNGDGDGDGKGTT